MKMVLVHYGRVVITGLHGHLTKLTVEDAFEITCQAMGDGGIEQSLPILDPYLADADVMPSNVEPWMGSTTECPFRTVYDAKDSRTREGPLSLVDC